MCPPNLNRWFYKDRFGNSKNSLTFSFRYGRKNRYIFFFYFDYFTKRSTVTDGHENTIRNRINNLYTERNVKTDATVLSWNALKFRKTIIIRTNWLCWPCRMVLRFRRARYSDDRFVVVIRRPTLTRDTIITDDIRRKRSPAFAIFRARLLLSAA